MAVVMPVAMAVVVGAVGESQNACDSKAEENSFFHNCVLVYFATFQLDDGRSLIVFVR
jgi:hypothetical protein